MASGLTLPMVFWHRDNVQLKHAIQCLAVEEKAVISGGKAGEMVFWRQEELGLVPRIVATANVNHECKELVLLPAPPLPEQPFGLLVASLHADNRVRIWDYLDGRCIAATSASMFGDSFVIARICAISKRFVAIAGSEKSIHILDIWTMTRLCSYKTQGELVDITARSMGEKTRLAAVHGEGFVTLWDFTDSGDITSSPECNFARPTAKLTMVIEETPTKVAISRELDIVAMAYERTVSFIHESWVILI